MKNEEILLAFIKEYGHLRNSGLKEISLVNEWEYDEISITTPFIFDHRKLPHEFMGLRVKGHTDDLPQEFENINNDTDYIWAYQRFEDYVERHADLIRQTLDKPAMTRDEMLDALCFGDFKTHQFHLSLHHLLFFA